MAVLWEKFLRVCSSPALPLCKPDTRLRFAAVWIAKGRAFRLGPTWSGIRTHQRRIRLASPIHLRARRISRISAPLHSRRLAVGQEILVVISSMGLGL